MNDTEIVSMRRLLYACQDVDWDKVLRAMGAYWSLSDDQNEWVEVKRIYDLMNGAIE